MSTYEKLILDALRDYRKRWIDLERVLVKSGKMSKPTLARYLHKLEKEQKIRRFVDYSKKPLIVWYMLAGFESSLERKVRDVVEELRRQFKFFKEPQAEEVAVRVGETPETVRPTLFKLAPKIGWKEQKKGEAEKEAENAINLAGWLKWLEKEEMEKFREVGEMAENEEVRAMDALQIRQIFRQKIEEINMMAEEKLEKASNDVLIRAKRILKECPTLIPDVKPIPAGAKLNEWPEETRRTWYRVFGSEPPTPTRKAW